MPVPQAVIDILNSFSIVDPSAGTQVPIGTRLAPALNATPVTAFALLRQPEVLANLDLDINLNDVSLNLSPSDGAASLNIVLQAVEFPEPAKTSAGTVDVSALASGKLPYLKPSTSTIPAGYVVNISSNVEGLLGKAEGKIKQVERIVGSLVGKITGRVTRTLLGAAPQVTVTWSTQDAAGQDLDGTQVVNFGTQQAPIYLFLPEFVEFSDGPPTTTERRLACTITVAIAGESVSRTVGPITIQIPQVKIPTILVLTQTAPGIAGAPGSILLGVPANSAINDNTNIASVLGPVSTILGTLAGALTGVVGTAAAFAAFTAAGTAMGRLTGLLGRKYFVKSTGQGFGWWLFDWGKFDKSVSSMVMIGPPGRRLRLYAGGVDWFWGTYVQRFGALDVTLGPTGTVDIPNFAMPAPAPMPPANTVTGFPPFNSTVTVSDPGAPALGTFDKMTSAYKFLAPQEV